MSLSTMRTADLASLLWVRVLIAAVFVELAVFGVAVLLHPLPASDTVLLYVVPPACLTVSACFGFWVARTAQHRHLLHGALVGVVAALIYITMTWGKVLPMAYVASHLLKVIGGALGGVLAGKRSAGTMRCR